MTSSGLKFPTPESLLLWLETRMKKEDLASWGVKPGTKTIHDLWIELVEGESFLDESATSPLRTVSVASVLILNPTDSTEVLIESHQLLSDGVVLHRDRPVAVKMKDGETFEDAASRAVKEELRSTSSVRIEPGSYQKKTRKKVSGSYPGLPTSYVIHTVKAYVDGLPGGEFDTSVKGEEEELQKYASSQVHDAVTVKKHFWKWIRYSVCCLFSLVGHAASRASSFMRCGQYCMIVQGLDGTIEKLLEFARSEFKVFNTELVKRALDSAVQANNRKKLWDDGPKVIWCLICTTMLLASCNSNNEVVAAGLLLDDSLCHNNHRYNILKKKFGIEVADLARDVSKISKLGKISQREHLRRSRWLPNLILASVGDPRAVMIKIAERLVQMIARDSLNVEKKKSFVNEILRVFVPLSERLGLNLWKNKLQCLCFNATNELKKFYASVSEYDKDAIHFKVKLEDGLKREKLPYKYVQFRKKSLQSIYNKMIEENISFNDMKDIIGLRIIVKSVDDCYRAMDVVKNLWSDEPELLEDFINRKPNEYRSLHVFVKNGRNKYMEVQIRTEEMHEQAEKSHWRYKERYLRVPEHEIALVEFACWVCKQARKVNGVEGQTTRPGNSSPHHPECPYAEKDKPLCLDATDGCKFPGKGPVYIIVEANNQVSIKQYLAGTQLHHLCLQRGLKGQLKGQVLVNEKDADSSYVLRHGDIIKFKQGSDGTDGRARTTYTGGSKSTNQCQKRLEKEASVKVSYLKVHRHAHTVKRGSLLGQRIPLEQLKEEAIGQEMFQRIWAKRKEWQRTVRKIRVARQGRQTWMQKAQFYGSRWDSVQFAIWQEQLKKKAIGQEMFQLIWAKHKEWQCALREFLLARLGGQTRMQKAQFYGSCWGSLEFSLWQEQLEDCQEMFQRIWAKHKTCMQKAQFYGSWWDSLQFYTWQKQLNEEAISQGTFWAIFLTMFHQMFAMFQEMWAKHVQQKIHNEKLAAEHALQEILARQEWRTHMQAQREVQCARLHARLRVQMTQPPRIRTHRKKKGRNIYRAPSEQN